jgi:hypothetical protein
MNTQESKRQSRRLFGKSLAKFVGGSAFGLGLLSLFEQDALASYSCGFYYVTGVQYCVNQSNHCLHDHYGISMKANRHAATPILRMTATMTTLAVQSTATNANAISRSASTCTPEPSTLSRPNRACIADKVARAVLGRLIIFPVPLRDVSTARFRTSPSTALTVAASYA